MKPKIRNKLLPYLYMIPPVVLILVVLGIPIINLIWYSFAKISFTGDFQAWVGFDNYQYLLSKQFMETLLRTLIWVVFGMSGMFFFGTSIALALNKPIPGRNFFRAAVIIPWVIPHVFAATMWTWVLDSNNGLINNILLALNLIDSPIGFFSLDTAMASVIWIRIWKGTPFIIMGVLSSLQSLSSEIEEAAKLDGACGIRYFWHILLPHLKPVMIMSGIILLAWSITTFDIIYATTGGGPLRVTEIVSISIYNEAFVRTNLGRASAIALFTMALISVTAIFLVRKNMRGDDRNESL